MVDKKPALDKENLLRNLRIFVYAVELFSPSERKAYQELIERIESGVFDMKKTKKECRTCKWGNQNCLVGEYRCSRYPPKRGLFDSQILPCVYPSGLCGEWCEQ